MSEHLETALQAFGKDGREVYADFGKQDIRDGDYFFYPFRMPLGERAVLEKVRAIPLCMLRNEKGEPDTYVFYTRNGVDPDFCVSGDASPITILTLSEEEALHAQKIIRDGRELLVISEMDLYQRENGTIAGLLRTKKRQCRKSESILYQSMRFLKWSRWMRIPFGAVRVFRIRFAAD